MRRVCKQPNKTHSESEGSSSRAPDALSVRDRFLPATLSSSVPCRERGDFARLESEGACMGGRELLPEDILPRGGWLLKVWAKEGRECVVMVEDKPQNFNSQKPRAGILDGSSRRTRSLQLNLPCKEDIYVQRRSETCNPSHHLLLGIRPMCITFSHIP